MARNTNNYSNDRYSLENYNNNDKYSETGESEFSRSSTVPFDEDEVLSERHYTFAPMESLGRQKVRSRERRSEEPSQGKFRGRGPKGYRRSDSMIKEDVCEALYRNTEVDASEIEVSASNGVVTLKGTVDTRSQKKAAEYAVEHLAGVDDVHNELRVRSPEKGTEVNSKYGLTDNITGLN